MAHAAELARTRLSHRTPGLVAVMVMLLLLASLQPASWPAAEVLGDRQSLSALKAPAPPHPAADFRSIPSPASQGLTSASKGLLPQQVQRSRIGMRLSGPKSFEEASRVTLLSSPYAPQGLMALVTLESSLGLYPLILLGTQLNPVSM